MLILCLFLLVLILQVLFGNLLPPRPLCLKNSDIILADGPLKTCTDSDVMFSRRGYEGVFKLGFWWNWQLYTRMKSDVFLFL